MIFSIAICDDSSEQIEVLRTMIHAALSEKEYTLTAFTSVDNLLAAQTNGVNADVLLLDICMPERNGISVAQEINRVSPSTQIIFISAFAAYAWDVYEAEHIYFLTKPVQEEKLIAALSRAIERLNDMDAYRITLPVRAGVQHILLTSEILYFERLDRKTYVHTASGELATPLRLEEIEALLPPDAFSRPHNSYLVNLIRVRSTMRSELTMANGIVIPISNQKRASFMAALARSF